MTPQKHINDLPIVEKHIILMEVCTEEGSKSVSAKDVVVNDHKEKMETNGQGGS